MNYSQNHGTKGEMQADERLGLFRKILPLSLEYPLFLSVFCDRKGTVKKYWIDLETAKDSHYELDPQQGEKLRLALASGSTLPQALADWAEKGCSCSRVESMLRHCGVVFRRLHL